MYTGVILGRTHFIVGGVGMVTCLNDGGVADRIEIVSEAGGLMTSQTSVQTLTLTIDPITDSLHNSDITCRVNRNSGTANQAVFPQTLTVTVDGERSNRVVTFSVGSKHSTCAPKSRNATAI